jgi:adenine-specific DNA-methyltransferase
MPDLNDLMPTTPDLNKERLEQLKKLMPDLFTNDGRLNVDELKRVVAPELVTESERFEFRWFGKAAAKRAAFTPSTAALQYDGPRSVNPEAADGNLIIEGENLEALKCLLAAYREKVKCIYIDPPYNTGKDFVYSDNYSETRKAYWEQTGTTEEGVKVDTNTESDGRFHSNWLNMIYPRLLVARQLLRDDGFIVISIDDAELHNLRRLLNEAFGEENYIATLVWDRNRKNDAKFFSVGHEYMVVFAKDKNHLKESEIVLRAEKEGIEEVKELFSLLLKKHGGDWEKMRADLKEFFDSMEDDDPRKQLGRFNKVDKDGPYRDDGDISWPGGGGPRYEIPHPVTKKPCTIPSRGWVFPDESKFWEEYEKGRVVFGSDENKIPSLRRNLFDKTDQVMRSVLFSYAQTATQKFNELFEGRRIFENPKHHEDIKKIVSYLAGNNDIILDFFAGSGTTGHAVMELNKEDGGNRKFILVQLPELTDEKSEAYKAGYKRISDITIERNKRVIARIEQEEAKREQGLFDAEKEPYRPGFRVYWLVKSHFPRCEFVPDPEKSTEENIEQLKAYIADKEATLYSLFNEADIFDEVMLKNGFMLSYARTLVEEFARNNVYLVRDDFKQALVCLDAELKEETIAQLKGRSEVFICLERAVDTTKKWNLKQMLGERLVAF